ncbi:hypothetical protein SNE40_002203 [Patella caerulea]|uniref:C-type lectin domain-containing protein n=1 Tax=Patella caerulea TaxID=87958 RepID=A0AAN8KCX3_PATCE
MDMSLTAKVENYKWHLKECTSTEKPYYGLCSRNDNEPNTCKGALISGDICYWLTVNIGDTDALNQECVQDGGMLASIPSQKILDDLDIFYSFALSAHNEIYFGVNSKVDPDTWTTWDNVPITWTYWQGGITLTDSSKACARLLPNSEPKYNWENHVCGETSYYGLCSTNNTFNLPSSSPPVHINVTTESVTESIDGTTHYTRTTESVISETSVSETTTETVTSKTPPFNQESETTTSEKTSSETTPFNIASETTPSGTMSSETTPSEITSSKTTSSSVSISNTTYICRCGTKLLNIGDDLLAQTLRELIANLTVDKHLLSSFIRKKTSADDERPSVKVVATLGIALYVIEICFIVALDGPWYYSVGKKIMKYFKKKLTKCND